MLKRWALVGALFAIIAGAPLILAAPAEAASVSVVAPCAPGWYVNEDEAKLAPKVLMDGFLFDGPSLMHRALGTPVVLGDAPSNGAFVAKVLKGVPPLFKMETVAPYSTVNRTSGGKYWSSKIVTGPGSQAAPVDSLTDLALLPPYTDASKVYSFGIGYANDTGNQALVKTVTFGPTNYPLACVPSASASASASVSATASASASAAPAAALPLTGAPVWVLVTIGGAAVSIGFAVVLLARRRRVSFRA